MYTQISKPLSILLIEDDQEAILINSKLLNLFGHIVKCVSTKDEAIKEEINNYDCILLDINLKNSSGSEIIYTIGQKSNFSKYHHIIVITNHLMNDIRDHYGMLGITQILQKPIDPDLLQQAVNSF